MNEASLFVVGALMLLATPGPTNTLLATSGAVVGVRQSLRLVAGEVLGYLVSICVLALVLGPVWNASAALRVSVKIGCGLYLVFVAAKLWRRAAAARDDDLGVRKVFVTTLLNPKAAIFAFVIIPHLATGDYGRAAPYLAATVGLILLVGTGWIAIGALIRTGGRGRVTPGRARRFGAVALVVFAALLIVSTGTDVSAVEDFGVHRRACSGTAADPAPPDPIAFRETRRVWDRAQQTWCPTFVPERGEPDP